MSSPTPSHSFEGYAVVSADGFFADVDGVMPDTLRLAADWDYFQAALDGADVTLIGRRTHEAAPNLRRRRRLVLSSRAEGVVGEDARTLWIDPARTDPCAAIAEVCGPGARVAVVGGQGVFDWVLSNPGFSAFHLSLAGEVRLEQGRCLFGQAQDLEAALALLAADGLTLRHRTWLDRSVALELLVYRRG
jgi:hypothetical protein